MTEIMFDIMALVGFLYAVAKIGAFFLRGVL